MKKIFFIIGIFFLSSIISHPLSKSNAQEIQQARDRKCLEGPGFTGEARLVNPVTVNLSGKGFPSGKTIDIEFCPPGGTKEKTQCSVVGTTKAQAGKVKASVTVNDLEQGVWYPFFGSWPHEELPMGKAETQQQGTLTFEQQDSGKCNTIAWDPYGRVFDSQSLEPIPNVKVSVLDKINPDELTQIVNNPQVVKNDGAFNFLTDPGTYFLKVTAPVVYSFSATPNLNTNYVKAYSKRDGSSSIYKPNEPIIEKAGKPEHRDIPLDPGKNPPTHFLVINMPGNYEQMVFGSKTKYGGKISHPLSIVTLVGSKTKKEIAKTAADKFGYWTILLDNLKIPQNEGLVIKLIKVDLTTGKADEKNARVTDDVTFEPILRTVQGYAYNSSWVVVPNATVQIVREGKNKTHYQTVADQNGYFSIPTDKLPVTSYYVVSETPTSSITERVSTSVFTARNASYLSKNQVNLMQQTKTSQASKDGGGYIQEKSDITVFHSESTVKESKTKKQNYLPFFLMLLVLFGATAAGLFFFAPKKKTRRKR